MTAGEGQVLKSWVREWLGMNQAEKAHHADLKAVNATIKNYDAYYRSAISEWIAGEDARINQELATLRSEIAQLRVEKYVPPVTPEPERKIIKTRNWREFTQILDQEQEAEETRNAV